jgi:methyl-accepting chemotaxis protein
MILKHLRIVQKIYLACGTLAVLIASALIYLVMVIADSSELLARQTHSVEEQTSTLQQEAELLGQQAQLVEKRRLINATIAAFSDWRYWLYDLQVSWLNESESNADAAKARLTELLGQLSNDGQLTGTLQPMMENFGTKMLSAVDAYIDNNRVLGNSLVAEARKEGGNIDRQLNELLQKTADQTTLVAQKVSTIGKQVKAAGLEVSQAATRVESNNARLRNGAWVVLALVLGLLFVFAWLLLAAISRPIAALEAGIREIERSSDLSRRLSVNSQDEIGATAQAVNLMLEKFRAMVCEVSAATAQVSSAGQNTRQVMESTHRGIQDQQSETDQVSTAITQMAHTVHEVARSAEHAAEVASQASQEANKGQSMVNQSVAMISALARDVAHAGNVVEHLSEDSGQIGKVLEVISSISEQTNLLALNAAIEAARAGEAGRGFAVVADEVRMLAQRTRESTQEINEMIARLQSGVQEVVTAIQQSVNKTNAGVQQVESTGKTLEAIIAAVQTINDLNAQIASAAEQQSAVTETINLNVVNIRDASSVTADAANNTLHCCDELTHLSEHLQEVVGQFRLG